MPFTLLDEKQEQLSPPKGWQIKAVPGEFSLIEPSPEQAITAPEPTVPKVGTTVPPVGTLTELPAGFIPQPRTVSELEPVPAQVSTLMTSETPITKPQGELAPVQEMPKPSPYYVKFPEGKEQGILPAFESGMERSNTGLIATGRLPKEYTPQNWAEELAQTSGMILGDIPFMAAGGAIGGVAGVPTGAGAAITAGGAAIALPSALRHVLMKSYETGGVKTFRDFWKLLLGTAKETGKGYVVGGALGTAGMIKPVLLRVPAEITTLASTGAVLEGRVPEPEDFEDAAILLLGYGASRNLIKFTKRGLQYRYMKEGVHPKETARDIVKSTPEIREQEIGKLTELGKTELPTVPPAEITPETPPNLPSEAKIEKPTTEPAIPPTVVPETAGKAEEEAETIPEGYLRFGKINPYYDLTLRGYQEENIEQLPKNIQQRTVGQTLEHAGDIFRELTGIKHPDPSYINEKIRRIKLNAKYIQDWEEKFTENDKRLIRSLINKYEELNLSDKPPLLNEVRKLALAIADKNIDGIETYINNIDKEIKHAYTEPLAKTVTEKPIVEPITGKETKEAEPIPEQPKKAIINKPVYHGTIKDFEKIGFGEGFRFSMLGEKPVKSKAIFFSENKSDAEFFAQNRKEYAEDKDLPYKQPRVIKAKINIQNPADLTTPQLADEVLNKAGISLDEEVLGLEDIGTTVEDEIARGDFELSRLAEIFDKKENIDKLQRAGYDGAILQESTKFGLGKSYAVFNESQIITKELKKPEVTEKVTPEVTIEDTIKDTLKGKKAVTPEVTIKPIRFEVGKKLTKDEKSEVLKSVVDVYTGHPKRKETITKSGEIIHGYEYMPDLFVKSDITGKMLRHYIKLPDGRIAHPTELYPNIKQSEVDREIARQQFETQKQERVIKNRTQTIETYSADTVAEANNLYIKRGGKYTTIGGKVETDLWYNKDTDKYFRVARNADYNDLLREKGYEIKKPQKPEVKAVTPESYGISQTASESVRKKIQSLGSLDAVNAFYSKGHKTDAYAKAIAPEVLGIEKVEVKPTERLEIPEKLKGMERRIDNEGNAIYVDWTQKKTLTKGLATGTFYKTFYENGEFAWWHKRKDIQSQYPQKGETKPVVSEEVKPSTEKQPWEMNKDEYLSADVVYFNGEPAYLRDKTLPSGGKTKAFEISGDEWYSRNESDYEYLLEKALSEGKTPYKGWEKDYPDLVKKPSLYEEGKRKFEEKKAEAVPEKPEIEKIPAEEVKPEIAPKAEVEKEPVVEGKKEPFEQAKTEVVAEKPEEPKTLFTDIESINKSLQDKSDKGMEHFVPDKLKNKNYQDMTAKEKDMLYVNLRRFNHVDTVRDFMNKIENVTVPYSEDEINKISVAGKKFLFEAIGNRHAIMSDKSGSYASNGHWLIKDAEIAQKLRDEYWQKNPEYIEARNDNPPNFENVVPSKKELENKRPVFEQVINYNIYRGITKTGGIIVLSDGKTQIGLNAKFYKWIKKTFPNTKPYAVYDSPDKPIVFMDGNKFKALLMPIRLDEEIELPSPDYKPEEGRGEAYRPPVSEKEKYQLPEKEERLTGEEGFIIIPQIRKPKEQELSEQRMEQPFELKPETKMQALRRHIQDKMARLGYVQKQIGIKESEETKDVYLQAELYIGRASDKVQKLEKEFMEDKDSFLKRLYDDDLNIEAMGEYLLAKHAKERNAHIQKINPKFKQTDAITESGGSGISDKEADAILDAYKDTKLEQYAQEVYDKITKRALKIRLDSGDIDKETYDSLLSYYKNYVPLKGKAEVEQYPNIGSGFSVAGKGIKRARGRRSLPNNPLIQAFIDLEEATIRAEKIKVGQSLLQLVREHPSEYWEEEKLKYIPRYDKNGEIQYLDPKYKFADNVIDVKENGKTILVTIHDKAMVEGLKNMGLGRSVKYLNNINQYLRYVSTVANPEFIITNFERDLQTSLIHLSGEQSSKIAKDTVKDIPKAMKGIWRNIRTEEGGKWVKLYAELKERGGKIGWFEQGTLEERTEKFERKLRTYRHANNFEQAARESLKFISDLNECVESGVRLAAYKNLVDSGVSKDRAAQISKNLTVNFNKKGTVGATINSIYMFSNAGIQGTARIFKAMGIPFKPKTKGQERVQRIVAGLIAVSFLQSLINRLIDPDDYDRMSPFVKDNYWIFMLPNHKSLSIKVPYGYNIFKTMGNIAEEYAFGDITLPESGTRLLIATNNAFNPLSGGSFAQFLSPTAFDPIISLTENKNWFGGKIRPDQPAYQPKIPRSQLFFKSVRKNTKAFTDWLNKVTGGSEKTSGFADISPEDVDFIIDFMGGGLGTFITNALDTGKSLLTEQDFPEIWKIPIMRQFIKEPSEFQDKQIIYQMLDESQRTQYGIDQIIRFTNTLNRAVNNGEIEKKKQIQLRNEFIKNQFSSRVFEEKDKQKLFSSINKAVENKSMTNLDGMKIKHEFNVYQLKTKTAKRK